MPLPLSIYPNATTRFVLLYTVIKLLLYPRTYHGSQTSIKPHPNCPRFSSVSHLRMFCSNHPFRANLKPQNHFSCSFTRFRMCQFNTIEPLGTSSALSLSPSTIPQLSDPLGTNPGGQGLCLTLSLYLLCAEQSCKFYHVQVRCFYFCHFSYSSSIPISSTYDKLVLY